MGFGDVGGSGGHWRVGFGLGGKWRRWEVEEVGSEEKERGKYGGGHWGSRRWEGEWELGRWGGGESQKKSQNSREKKIIAAVMVFPVYLGTQAVWTLAAPPATTCSSPPLPYTRVKHLFKP